MYSQNKSEINGELLATSSKHIISLISSRDYRLSFDGANILLEGLAAIDISSLTEKSTSFYTQSQAISFLSYGLYESRASFLLR